MYLWRKHPTDVWLGKHWAALSERIGAGLAIIERPGKRPLVQAVARSRKQAAELKRDFGGRIETLPADWFRCFTKQSRPRRLRIGSRLVVGPEPGAKTIVIPAEAAFGTGDHATTAMCLRLLERTTRGVQPGWSMLDAGTGSGILAIAGAHLGARRVVAIDNDPIACRIAATNADANRVGNIEFRTGDVLRSRLAGRFDVITANLFSEILIEALPVWLPHLATDGRLILSGVLRSQERRVLTALKRNGCSAVEIKRRGKWIAVLAIRTWKRS